MARNEVEFKDVFIIKETAAALYCEIDGENYWIPKSQVTDNSEIWKEGETGVLTITQWIAEQKGLV